MASTCSPEILKWLQQQHASLTNSCRAALLSFRRFDCAHAACGCVFAPAVIFGHQKAQASMCKWHTAASSGRGVMQACARTYLRVAKLQVYCSAIVHCCRELRQQ